jgi:hypothetical protein
MAGCHDLARAGATLAVLLIGVGSAQAQSCRSVGFHNVALRAGDMGEHAVASEAQIGAVCGRTRRVGGNIVRFDSVQIVQQPRLGRIVQNNPSVTRYRAERAGTDRVGYVVRYTARDGPGTARMIWTITNR